MKGIRITFRLTPHQLARGLQVVKQLEPTYELTSINDMVKMIYHDYLSKLTMNRTSVVPQCYINEINAIAGTSSEKLTLENLFKKLHVNPKSNLGAIDLSSPNESNETNESPAEEQEIEIDSIYAHPEELSDETMREIDAMVNQTKKFNSILRASKFQDPNITDSELSTLTDFSPPKDWME